MTNATDTTNEVTTDQGSEVAVAADQTEVTPPAPVSVPPAPSTLQALVNDLKNTLSKLGHIAAKDMNMADAEVIKLANGLLQEYNAVLRNAGIITTHTLQVFDSLASRGKYPEELIKDSKVFKGREGWDHLKIVMEQILGFFKRETQPTEPSDTPVPTTEAPNVPTTTAQ